MFWNYIGDKKEMTVTCQGCGIELENWDELRKQWYEVSTGRPHTIPNCPQKEKLVAALKARREKMKSTDKNVEKYAVQMIYCDKCGATYSSVLKRCPQCKRNFVKSLFLPKK